MLMSEQDYAKALCKLGKPRRGPCDIGGTERPAREKDARQKPDKDEARRLVELWNAGLTHKAIGKILGKGRSTIGRWGRKLGLPRRGLCAPGGPLKWLAGDDAFVLQRYQHASKRWIAACLPSGRKVTRNAVIGRYGRLKEKQRQAAR